MAWAEPEYSRTRVDNAGNVLARGVPLGSREIGDEVEVFSNWRSAHSFPLNTFQNGLRNLSARVTSRFIVTQRLKRAASIIRKLQLHPRMSLSRMQDIGGVRSVVGSVQQVRTLREQYRQSRMKHEPAGERDYITSPKGTGYRGIHLVYRYRGRKKAYDNLRLEIQIRSRLQHAWATAVETVGVLVRSALKSSEGPDDWLQLFALLGSAFAHVEGCPPVPNTPADPKDLLGRITIRAKDLDVLEKLDKFRAFMSVRKQSKALKAADYYLLVLRPRSRALHVQTYPSSALTVATSMYLQEEQSLKTDEGEEAVLVAADSLAALKLGYPNYFLDTNRFVTAVRALLEGGIDAAKAVVQTWRT